ncbi:MAG: GTPase [Myxococcota bacterium]|nr:GTPase [Myxococcota bacterium]
MAVIGKPNAGKSTLVNRLLGEDRLLVSDVPGTTRDAIDTRLERPAEPAVVAEAEAALQALEAQLAGGQPEPAEVEEEAPEILEAAWDDDLVTEGQEDEEDDSPDPWTINLDLDLDMEDRAWAAPEDDAGDADLLAEARESVEAARAPRKYLFIDTAGIRRRKWIKTKLERVSIIQSFKAIDRAEICVLLIDATAGVTEQDAKLAGMIRDKGRACVLLVNKWDAIADKTNATAGDFVKELRDDLKFLRHAPVLFISGLTGQRVHRIFREVERVKMNARRRVSTGALNRFLASAVRRQQPPLHRNRRFRIYYASQVTTSPPTFLLYVNDPTALHFSYRRYLINQLRAAWDFEGTPIRLVLRRRRKSGR